MLFTVVTVGFGRPGVLVNESDGQFPMCVVKNRVTLVPVTVTITSTAGSATEGSGEFAAVHDGCMVSRLLPHESRKNKLPFQCKIEC